MREVALIFFLFLSISLTFGQENNFDKISQTIKNQSQSRFDSIAKTLNFKPGNKIKVSVLFTINEEGDIVDIKARSIHPEFEKEAIRVVSELPKMVPAEFNGKRISQKYALPLVFEIETDKEKSKRLRKEKRKNAKEKN